MQIYVLEGAKVGYIYIAEGAKVTLYSLTLRYPNIKLYKRQIRYAPSYFDSLEYQVLI